MSSTAAPGFILLLTAAAYLDNSKPVPQPTVPLARPKHASEVETPKIDAVHPLAEEPYNASVTGSIQPPLQKKRDRSEVSFYHGPPPTTSHSDQTGRPRSETGMLPIRTIPQRGRAETTVHQQLYKTRR